jgi:hypothetical protein
MHTGVGDLYLTPKTKKVDVSHQAERLSQHKEALKNQADHQKTENE